MTKVFLFSAAAILCAGLCSAQSSGPTDPNSNVFLDNHRPLIKKKDKAPTTRSVYGKVVDDTGQPVEGALVTLTNGKTNEKTTFFTKKDGRYSFDDLSFTNDYELVARYKSMNSEARKLSQYDRDANVVRILQVGPTEAEKAAATTEAKKEAPAPKK